MQLLALPVFQSRTGESRAAADVRNPIDGNILSGARIPEKNNLYGVLSMLGSAVSYEPGWELIVEKTETGE